MSPDYGAFGQITGLCPCQVVSYVAPKATRLAVHGECRSGWDDVIPMLIVGLAYMRYSNSTLQRAFSV
jgi:hypothetical protein